MQIVLKFLYQHYFIFLFSIIFSIIFFYIISVDCVNCLKSQQSQFMFQNIFVYSGRLFQNLCQYSVSRTHVFVLWLESFLFCFSTFQQYWSLIMLYTHEIPARCLYMQMYSSTGNYNVFDENQFECSTRQVLFKKDK